MAEVKPVEQFAPTGTEADKLLAYPYEAPTHGYFTDGETVTELADTYDSFVQQADAMLAERNLPLMANRIPVIEYGSNASPYQAKTKMGKFGRPEQQAALQSVPKIEGRIMGADVVWHGKPGQKGSTFAELYKDEKTNKTQAPCQIAFMTEQQLAVMNGSEGMTYNAVLLDVLVGDDKKPMQAIAYVAGQSSVLLKDGKPVKVQRPGAAPIRGAMTAEQAVNYMLEHAGDTIGLATARELVEVAGSKNYYGKLALQKPVAEALKAAGVSQDFSFPKPAEHTIGRADFNSIHSGGEAPTLRLMEDVVADLRPSAAELDHKATDEIKAGEDLAVTIGRVGRANDLAQVLRKRAHDELAVEIEKKYGDKKEGIRVNKVTWQQGKLVTPKS